MAQGKYPTEEIRERSDLVEIVSQHVVLRKSGAQLKGLCPFHNEKTPSFQVSPDKGIWKCFGCGEGGDVFSFVQKIENISFREAVELLANRAGIRLESSPQEAIALSRKDRLFRANALACRFYEESLRSSRQALDYLASRNIPESAISKYRLGYAPDSWDGLRMFLERNKVAVPDAVSAGLLVARENSMGFYDRFRHRLMFPILDISDRVIAFGGRIMGPGEPKYLNSPETPLFSKTKTLYGLNFARKAVPKLDQLIVVEGYMDTLTVQEAGFENTVATLGTALTSEHVNVIARYTKNVVLCYDADSAGMNAALKAAGLFEESGMNVRVMKLPAGEDPDSLLAKGDRSVFANLAEKAVPVIDYKLSHAVRSFDLKTAEGRTEALKVSVDITAEVDSIVERERLIRVMARLHPNFGSGTTRAEDHIRADIERVRARAPGKPRVPVQPVAGGPKSKKPWVSLRDRTEKVILGMIIYKNINPNKVFVVCPANEFLQGPNRVLAQQLQALGSKSKTIEAADIYEELADPESRQLLTDLVVGVDESEYDQSLQDLLTALQTQIKQESIARARELMKKVQEGSVSRDTPEYEEYMKLLKESSSPFRR